MTEANTSVTTGSPPSANPSANDAGPSQSLDAAARAEGDATDTRDTTPAATGSHPAKSNTNVLRIGGLTIYPDRYDVYVGTRRVDLTASQFRMVLYLAQRPGRVLSPDQIAKALAAYGTELEPLAIKNHIYSIRRKLGPAAMHIRTVRGVGYGLTEEPQPCGGAD